MVKSASSNDLRMAQKSEWSGTRPACITLAEGTGRPPKLTGKQARQVFRWINGRDPRQYGFVFGLWMPSGCRVDCRQICHRTQLGLGWQAAGEFRADAAKPLLRTYERDLK